MDEIRLFFKKTGTARFISHLDLNRAFIRALFASGLPVWFTEGFNRHPHLVFGQPLPLGMAGLRETLDMRLNESVDCSEICERLNRQLPYGIEAVSAAAPVHKLKEITFARYTVDMDASYAARFDQFWSADKILSSKKTKRAEIEIELKSEVECLTAEVSDGRLHVCAVMPCSFDCSLGPAVLMSAFERYVGEDVFRYSTRDGFLMCDMKDYV